MFSREIITIIIVSGFGAAAFIILAVVAIMKSKARKYDPLDQSPLIDPVSIELPSALGTTVRMRVNRDNANRFNTFGPRDFPGFMGRMNYPRKPGRFVYEVQGFDGGHYVVADDDILYKMLFGQNEFRHDPLILQKFWQDELSKYGDSRSAGCSTERITKAAELKEAAPAMKRGRFLSQRFAENSPDELSAEAFSTTYADPAAQDFRSDELNGNPPLSNPVFSGAAASRELAEDPSELAVNSEAAESETVIRQDQPFFGPDSFPGEDYPAP